MDLVIFMVINFSDYSDVWCYDYVFVGFFVGGFKLEI